MGVSKVNLSSGETLIDLTNDSVTPETLAEGVTAHDESGNLIVGIMRRAEDLNDVLTEQETLIAELKEVLQGKASAPPAETMVGLWELNEELNITLEGEYYVKIKKLDNNPEDFIGLTFFDGIVVGLLENTNGSYIDYYEEGFVHGLSRLVSIIEDPDDPELAEWIKANGRKLGYEDGFASGYAEGEKAILSTYVDWAVSAASNACIVDFYNECDYYAHISVMIDEFVSGEYYSEDFVLAPWDSYSISTEEIGWQVQSAEWRAEVVITKFSKDGDGEI